MADLQVTCINKSDRTDPHERILRIGGGQTVLGSWTKSQQDAIAEIEAGDNRFFVHADGKSVWVIVATSRYGNKYLKTEADGEQPNNLLSLRECPE